MLYQHIYSYLRYLQDKGYTDTHTRRQIHRYVSRRPLMSSWGKGLPLSVDLPFLSILFPSGPGSVNQSHCLYNHHVVSVAIYARSSRSSSPIGDSAEEYPVLYLSVLSFRAESVTDRQDGGTSLEMKGGRRGLVFLPGASL